MGIGVDFGQMFLANEVEDESTTNLTDVLVGMALKWEKTFSAADIATLLNDSSNQKSNEEKGLAAALRHTLYPDAPGDREVSPRSVGRLLKRYVGTPVLAPDGQTLRLETTTDTITNVLAYRVGRRK
jgi:hypothetical protein